MTVPASQKIGLIAATSIVAANMMGSGIALLPSSLASVGSITIISWIIASTGALALGYVYATLSYRDPQPGGPIAYSGEVAPILGYQAGLLYFHAGWIGNIGSAIVGVDYLSVFFPSLTDPMMSGIATIIIIWLLTCLNFFGSAMVGKLVTIGVILILVPVLVVSILGWFAFSPEIFMENWFAGKSSSHSLSDSLFSVMMGVVLCIWAFIGIESASTNAGLVDNPKRNVPLATMLGAGITAVIYAASCTAISGMFSNDEIAKSGAPFSLAISHMVDVFAQDTMSAATIHQLSSLLNYVVSIAFSCGVMISLTSWIMMIAQAGLRASNDGTLPKLFGERNAKGIPVKGMVTLAVFCTCLMILLVVVSFFSGLNTQNMFSIIASVVVLFTIIPYFYSALQLIRLQCLSHVPFRKAVTGVIFSLIAIVWCFVALGGATHNILIVSVICILGVLILYVGKDRTGLEAALNQLRAESLQNAIDGSQVNKAEQVNH